MSSTEFTLIKRHTIASLNAELCYYRHQKTGAEHYHIAADFPENVFLVGFRTVPSDSSGVAHVLEHTLLCGSKQYPVRDPFFMMSRRSLNSFMNAFTASDWTAYPFASEHEKDYYNLLDIYLDAAFFPNLDYRDFLQEGHRLSLSETGELAHEGVVYNEMLGAMQPVTAQLWDQLCKSLFSTSTYHFNSGGDPDQITQLTHEQLVEFYRTHYHPSNAIFMTFGDQDVARTQEKIHQQALCHFQRQVKQIAVAPELRHDAPMAVESAYPTSDESAKSHVLKGWLLPQSDDPLAFLTAHLLSDLLLDHSGSPLRQRLETCPLAQAPSPLCGVDDSMRDTLFVFGLEGVDDTDKAHQYLTSALEQVIEQGFSEQEIESALHQLEFMQREISGDGMPFGLQLIMQGLGAAVHRRDVFATLDIEPLLAELRQRAQQPNWLVDTLKAWTLENSHCVSLTLNPDLHMAERQRQRRADQLHQLQSQLDEPEIAKIKADGEALAERQAQQDDVSCLPSMHSSDVRPAPHRLTPTKSESGYDHYQVGSNGISHRYHVRTLAPLNEEQMALLPLYAGVLPELGCGDKDYVSMQSEQARDVGAFGAGIQYRADQHQPNRVQMLFSLGGKALSRNTSAIESYIQGYSDQARFDESKRIHELVKQAKLRREQSITNSGHVLAMMAASSPFSGVASQAHQWSGLGALQVLRDFDQSLSGDASTLLNQLADLHQTVIAQPAQVLAIDDRDGATALKASPHQGIWQDWQPQVAPAKRAFTTDTNVNFCARALKGCAMTDADAGALTVLAQVLKNGFLHSAIREQGGAYGGGASYDNANGVLRFYSYRDPRLTETFADFDQALSWARGHITQAMVDEGILSVIASLDRPLSPSGEAKSDYFNRLFGRQYDDQLRFRQQVLAVTAAELKAVAERYLMQSAYDVVICGQGAAPEGFTVAPI